MILGAPYCLRDFKSDVLRFEQTDIIQDFSDFCQTTSATFIFADCGGTEPEVDCPCCLTCCIDGFECQGE